MIKQCCNSLYQSISIYHGINHWGVHVAKTKLDTSYCYELVSCSPNAEISTPSLVVKFLLGIYNKEFFE